MSSMTNPDLEAALPPMAQGNRHQAGPVEPLPAANYNALSERFRKSTPSDLQCAMFCGGRKCKYETPHHWTPEDMALASFYSHWVTDDILAMARPNMETIAAFDLLKQFKESGVKTIINLQEPGEHSSCGPPLTSSGFSYEPSLFMDSDVYFYNFQWKDYSTVPESLLLDMVKVMTFSLTEGKVAVHCHAGLGRTGVFIASYLCYTWRCRPQDAIRYVRSKRPNSIQMRSQIESVFQFAQFVVPLFVLYPHIVPKHYGLTLTQHLKRQAYLLHGYESRHLRNIPKVLYVICERLLYLCDKSNSRSPGLARAPGSSSFESAKSAHSSDSDLNPDNLIDFQLSNSQSFCKYFFATASSTSQTPSSSRPQSNMTIQLSSGFASPDTATTDLSITSNGSRGGTADSKRSQNNGLDAAAHQLTAKQQSSLPVLAGVAKPTSSSTSPSLTNHSTPSASASTSSPSSNSSQFHYHHHHQGQFVTSLPPVEELSDSNSTLFPDLTAVDFTGPLRQIGLVGLDTPKKLKGNRYSFIHEDAMGHENNGRNSEPNSPCDSLTSLIEKTLGYRVMQAASSSPVVNNNDITDAAQNNDINEFSDSSESYTNFEEVLARTGLVSQDMYQDFDERSLLEERPSSAGFDANQLPVEPFLVVSGLLTDYRLLSDEFTNFLTQYQRDLNNRGSAWERLSHETNIEVLCALLWSWLENLKEPIFNRQALTYIVLKAEKPIDALIKLETGSRFTCEYLLRFIGRLQPETEEIREYLIKRLVAALCHQCIKINETLVPGDVTWPEMRKGTAGRVQLFLNGLYLLLRR